MERCNRAEPLSGSDVALGSSDFSFFEFILDYVFIVHGEAGIGRSACRHRRVRRVVVMEGVTGSSSDAVSPPLKAAVRR